MNKTHSTSTQCECATNMTKAMHHTIHTQLSNKRQINAIWTKTWKWAENRIAVAFKVGNLEIRLQSHRLKYRYY